MSAVLSRSFYSRDTIEVARDLLGQRLVVKRPGARRMSGRIVETEAYIGPEDPAAHSFGGRRTERTEPMFGRPGLSYVYFIYGMYFCLNVVTAAEGTPEAVLIRALEPVEGVVALDRKPLTLANGPGKLCRWMGIDRSHNALDLTDNRSLWIEKDLWIPPEEIIQGPRVGIGDRHDAVHWPLRFGVAGHQALSPTKLV